MPEFVNPHGYAVHVHDPNGKVIKIGPYKKIVLSEFYDKYRKRGFLRLASQPSPTPPPTEAKIQAKIHANRPAPLKPTPLPARPVEAKPKRDQAIKARKIAIAKANNRKPVVQTNMRPQKVPGRNAGMDPNELLRTNLEKNNYPVSNNIGVGILSYNRAGSLRRLVESITRTTDLRRTTVFISDDGSTDPATVAYLDELSANNNFVILRNQPRLGIAGNSNRLLRCLSRFKYGVLLNDDVEILAQGWEHFYPEAMARTGLHHLIYRQPGVYGAERGSSVVKNGTQLYRVDDKPHGAVLAFDHVFLQKVGYFDESYGLYGMEHVDWSQRAWELGVQEAGFYDAAGSDAFFKLFSERSAVADRPQLLKEARDRFANRTASYVPPSDSSKVPEVAYVVPFRNFERTKAILTVMNNLRAQRFPAVHLLMVEQDRHSGIDLVEYQPVSHHLVPGDRPLFNKSKAFNHGVSSAPCEMVILHDADMMAQGHYTESIVKVLREHESCHLGSTVMYTNRESMEKIADTGIVDQNVKCDRVVGYYEGGSLACTKTGYWKCGGFNEDYWGYGCEDCDFYARLSGASNWKEDRVFDFLHLWHSRVGGWDEHHKTNKAIEGQLKRLQMQERVSRQHSQLRQLGYSKELSEALQ